MRKATITQETAKRLSSLQCAPAISIFITMDADGRNVDNWTNELGYDGGLPFWSF